MTAAHHERIPVWTTVATGAHRTPDELLRAVHDGDCTTTATATALLYALRLQSEPGVSHLTTVRVKDLRLPKGVPYGRVRNAAADYGCIQCLPEIGPLLRIQLRDQPAGQRLIIAAQPVQVGDECLLFTVQHFPAEDPFAGLCLDTVSTDEQFYDDDVLVFAVPEPLR